MYGVPTFLEFPVTSKPNHLVKIADIVTVVQGNANTKLEFHMANGKVITATSAADASLENVAICSAAIKTALAWNVAKKGVKVSEVIVLTKAISAVAAA